MDSNPDRQDSIVKFGVPEEIEHERLDRFLASHEELQLSRTKVQQLLTDGKITVNDKPADKKQKLKPGDQITVELPEKEEITFMAEDIPLDIVYEDKYLVVVNKPAGMVTHPAIGNRRGTLANALAFKFESLADTGEPDRPGIVHRLDKNTSGLLLVARDNNTLALLQRAIQDRKVHRTYHGLVCGHLKEDSGTIDAPLGRSRQNRLKMTVLNSGGREAITHYRLLKRYGLIDQVEATLETGRTHQIRVHFAHIHHPVFGDPDYGGRDSWCRSLFGPQRPLGKELLSIFPRQALHAIKLAFEHPVTNEKLEFEAQLPADFQAVIDRLEQ